MERGKVYLGAEALGEVGVVPGSWVRVVLPSSTVLARVWLHPVPQVDYCQLQCAVVEGRQGHRHPCLLPSPLPSSLVSLEKVEVGEVSMVEVEVVVAPGSRRRGLEVAVRRLLRNIPLSKGCWVAAGEEGRRRYGVVGVVVTAMEGVARLVGEVVVTRVVGERRLRLLEEGHGTAVLGGVDGASRRLEEGLAAGEHCLVAGPSGSGKTALVESAAAALGVPVVRVGGGELGRPEPGAAEAALREVWAEAREVAEGGRALLLLEDVDCLCGGAAARRVGAQLQALLESGGEGVVVAATTTSPELLPATLRRPGRLGREVALGTPDREQRAAMLSCLASEQLASLLPSLAVSTNGFLPSDLALLVNRLSAVQDSLTPERVAEEVARARPAALRSGLATVVAERVTWDSLGGLEEVKAGLRRAVELPLLRPEAFRRLGVRPSKGVLLWGPPGCGKTRLVRAVASCCTAAFMAISPAEVFSPYVGDSEKTVVEVFRKARMAAPTILFIGDPPAPSNPNRCLPDEIDALVAGRDAGGQQSNSDRVGGWRWSGVVVWWYGGKSGVY